MITKLKKQCDGLLATLDDGTTVSIPFGYSGHYNSQIQEHLDNGGEIEVEFTDEELAQQAIDKAKAEAQAYLASTDWMVIRFADTGVVIPDEVKALRAEARLKI